MVKFTKDDGKTLIVTPQIVRWVAIVLSIGFMAGMGAYTTTTLTNPDGRTAVPIVVGIAAMIMVIAGCITDGCSY